jgi:hypothetical protein
MSSNDNYVAPAATPSPPDSHGQAALLLVESLIHGLIERSVITHQDGLDIIETAISVQGDVARAADGNPDPMWHAHSLLTRVAGSLEIDLRGSP